MLILDSKRRRWIKGAKDYAKPVGRTAERAEFSRNYISKQINMLCYVIQTMGRKNDEGEFFTTFGELFER